MLRTDLAINFNWGGGSPAPVLGVDYFSVRWEGQIMPRYTETYTFYAGSDDGVRLWINGQLIVDNWWDRAHTEGTGTINLVMGQSYDIRMEYYEKSGGVSASLVWSSARQAKEIVPQSFLFVPSKSGNYWSNALNQYTRVGGQTLDYDSRFNLKSYAGATFTFNAPNQLVSASKGTNTVQFIYDGLGRCLKRTTNGASIIFTYDGWKPIAEWAGDGSYWGFRIYGAGPDEILVHYDSRYGYSRVHSDVHGSVFALLDWNGSPLEKYTFDAFGKPKITDWAAGSERATSTARNRFLYTGREWIAKLGIYDYRNRMYLPELGRFLQMDPTGFDGGDMNLFRYCADDPVDLTDPMGLTPFSRDEFRTNLTSWGRGEWVKGSDGLTAWDRDHGMPSNRPQPGMDNGFTMAGQYRNSNALKGLDEATIGKGRRILAQQTKEGEDSTGAIKDGKVVPGDRVRGKQVPYTFGKPVYAPSGNSVLAARKIHHMEEPVPPGRSDVLTHYHSRTGFSAKGRSLAEPSDMDMEALRTTGAMLFSNPYLKADGAYRIYRNGVAGYQTRYGLYDP